jgi:hypothetical protein
MLHPIPYTTPPGNLFPRTHPFLKSDLHGNGKKRSRWERNRDTERGLTSSLLQRLTFSSRVLSGTRSCLGANVSSKGVGTVTRRMALIVVKGRANGGHSVCLVPPWGKTIPWRHEILLPSRVEERRRKWVISTTFFCRQILSQRWPSAGSFNSTEKIIGRETKLHLQCRSDGEKIQRRSSWDVT